MLLIERCDFLKDGKCPCDFVLSLKEDIKGIDNRQRELEIINGKVSLLLEKYGEQIKDNEEELEELKDKKIKTINKISWIVLVALITAISAKIIEMLVVIQ